MTNLVWQCMFITSGAEVSCGKAALLYSKSRSQWRFWTSVNVCPDNISDRSNLVWLCIIIISRVSFRNINFLCPRSNPQSFLLDLQKYWNFLQSKLVWWYIITRQGKTPWKDFLAFTEGVRQRIWFGWLWTRLLPLLAIPISKAGVSTGSNQENVERTLLL